MSDTEDPDSRTEEATEKKLQDTLEQGKLPVARDAGTAFGIFAILGSLSFLADSVTPRLVESLGLLLSNAGALPLRGGSDAYRYVEAVHLEIGRFLTPLVITFVVSGVAASFLQGAPQFIFERIQPDVSRISPRAGWSRIFGLAGAIELVKSIVKMGVVGGAIVLAGTSDRGPLIDAMRTDPSQLPVILLRLVIHMTSVVALAVAVIAMADYFWGRFKWRRDLRMSKQELKDEFKQAEGDPLVKARMRSLAMDRARKRMMASVPKATFVIANPTHYAIALRFVREEGGAPLVLAKGKDLVALKIREIAVKHNVPVLEKKELARAMFDLVEIDQMIPPEFYRPVAELIHFLSATGARR